MPAAKGSARTPLGPKLEQKVNEASTLQTHFAFYSQERVYPKVNFKIYYNGLGLTITVHQMLSNILYCLRFQTVFEI